MSKSNSLEAVARKHRLRIAKDTLKLNDTGAVVMGGMSKQEARDFLKNKMHWSDNRIKKWEAT